MARERLFFVTKAAGADDIIDAVIPRAAIPEYLARVSELASEHGTFVTGCGHVGDGNVHLGVFQPDPEKRIALEREILRTAIDAGGAVSGEHGIGTAKLAFFLELEDPSALGLDASHQGRVRSEGHPRSRAGCSAIFQRPPPLVPLSPTRPTRPSVATTPGATR